VLSRGLVERALCPVGAGGGFRRRHGGW
jgi:hypothetical protein